jgi:hypothetical protein
MAEGGQEVEVARHDIRIAQLMVDVERLERGLEENRQALRKFESMATTARVVMIGAIAIGGFGSWVLGVADGVRRFFSHP